MTLKDGIVLFNELVGILVWPIILICIIKSFKMQIADLLTRIISVSTPLISANIESQTRAVEEKIAESKAKDASNSKDNGVIHIEPGQVNQKHINLGLLPTPSGLDFSFFRHYAKSNPTLALAGLRIEIEVLAQNLAKAYELPEDYKSSAYLVFVKLAQMKVISYEKAVVAGDITRICQEALSGAPISVELALRIINVAEILAKEYVKWLLQFSKSIMENANT